jgi:ABC-type multidrug transport system fused ATPase/permease subunit
MPSKFVKTLKTIGRKWFIFLIIAILIVFIFYQLAAIIMTIVTIVLFTLSYIPTLIFNKNLKNFLLDYSSIEDKMVARKLKRSLPKIQEKMHNLSKKQNKKNWLIIFTNKHYIFYNERTVEKFREYYTKGLGEKEILEKLKKSNIKTRAEIKAIEEILVENSRLEEREVSVKEYRDKQRFS